MREERTMSIAGLVCGIIGILLCFKHPILGIAVGVAGIVLSLKGRRYENAAGLATGGLVCSIIAVAVGCLMVVFFLVFVILLGSALAAM